MGEDDHRVRAERIKLIAELARLHADIVERLARVVEQAVSTDEPAAALTVIRRVRRALDGEKDEVAVARVCEQVLDSVVAFIKADESLLAKVRAAKGALDPTPQPVAVAATMAIQTVAGNCGVVGLDRRLNRVSSELERAAMLKAVAPVGANSGWRVIFGRVLSKAGVGAKSLKAARRTVKAEPRRS